MRILHVITSLDPKQGGPPVVATRLAAAQASLGHQVEIVAYADPSADERFRKSVQAIPGFEGVTVHLLPLSGGILSEFLRGQGPAWFRQHVGEYDYLHLHGIWNPILLDAAKAATRAGRPYAVVPHGMLDPWCLYGQSFAKRIKKQVALAVAYRRMINDAAFLHVLNADEGRLMEPLRLRPPTVVLPNGVFLGEVSPLPPAGDFLAKHPELQGQPYILFLSRLHFKKGLDYLADAFAVVARERPALRLVIAGPDDGIADSLRQQLRGLGVEDRAHLVGPLYGPDKLAAFVDCACFCLPSRQEGFSMAITEALACSKPVVISDQCHFPEVAEVGAGYVVPCDAVKVADALRTVLSASPEATAKMGAAGRELVTGRFTWPKIAERTIEAYSQHPAGPRR